MIRGKGWTKRAHAGPQPFDTAPAPLLSGGGRENRSAGCTAPRPGFSCARMTQDPDADLVRRVAAGEPAAMRAMVATKLPRLLALATRMLGDRAEAEDVAQETFLRIWKHAGTWRQGRAKFDTWTHRVALNLCHDRLRRKREVSMAEPPDLTDTAPLPDAGLGAEEAGRLRVERALQAIAPRQREAIILVYYQEMSNIEAAAVMQVSVDALESLLARGRRALQQMLVQDEEGEA
ncbi:RNA polymerase sigma factor [Rhizobium sp. RU35A]|uniref:RNA polymerase sigma factor n=1 Tax=Rhizobium sp. RU35A TaxID=1907414 RepID=UPI00122CCAB7|nr:RNA polymerase sigma factor [Rhizobium sp. RU35A]